MKRRELRRRVFLFGKPYAWHTAPDGRLTLRPLSEGWSALTGAHAALESLRRARDI
ncbi:hypothetical protein [Streptomyces viridochromogenes]|uniref:hypothetical protein n=1 Tax=Streptomyces viridochromogenes TaxID=1938 RepID=UPI000B257837|nr:hypothetical protein [Streptomyces viridochromogenes]